MANLVQTRYILVLFALLTVGRGWQGQPLSCEPAAEIRSELEKAGAANATGPNAINTILPPLAALRDRYPNDLFVHEAYQNAVLNYGVQGYLKNLTKEYRALYTKHPDDPLYHYLYLHSLLGRGTRVATAGLHQMAAQYPNFSSAIKTLAQIYATGVFRDAEKERSALERLADLCPGQHILPKLDALPDKSALLGQAERVLAENGDPDRVISLANQALVDDEWRNQRISLFDWYSIDYKRESLRELRMEYLRAWAIQVRCYRKAGRPEKASEVLRQMEPGVAAIRGETDPAYWDALEMLASLYLDGKQVDLASQTLDRMHQLLVEHPDPDRASALGRLRKALVAASSDR
jgi:pentatricopeptide repeat protein